MEYAVDYENYGINATEKDGCYRFNPEKDHCKWASGRYFSYGDGKGTLGHYNWHRTIFSPRYLKKVMINAGLVDLVEMSHSEVRGHDHGWINLGMRGTKP